MRQAAIDALENFGPNPALVGQGVEAKSGKAIQLLQQAGIVPNDWRFGARICASISKHTDGQVNADDHQAAFMAGKGAADERAE